MKCQLFIANKRKICVIQVFFLLIESHKEILIFVDDSVLLIWDKSKNSIVCVQQFNSLFYVNMYIVIQLTYRKYIKQCSRCWELYMDNFFLSYLTMFKLMYKMQFRVYCSDIRYFTYST